MNCSVGVRTVCSSLFTVVACLLLFTVPGFSDPIQSTLEDQKGVEVTVYNNNLGLVKDVRKINLPVSEGELRFMDVAEFIMPVTVHVKSLDAPDAMTVLEQNYEYDLLNADKLLDKYVGKNIKLVEHNPYQDTTKSVDAVLLSNNEGQIYKIGDEIHLGHAGFRVLPGIPADLIAKPTLTWLYNNTYPSPQRIEVSYLTDNISWKADYVIVLNNTDTLADISGWVTIDNRSGATFREARLKLVAGDINRVQSNVYRNNMMQKAEFDGAINSGFSEKSFFEYHIYDLQRTTNLKNKQTKQINLLEAMGVPVQKEYLVYGQQSYFTQLYRERNPKQPVNVWLKFANSKESHLGMPLPSGVMRLYKEDENKSLQFIGEDKIEHTAKDEDVKLKVGEAFDIVAERVQKNFQQVTTRMYESEWEVTLRSHKDEGVIVGVVDPVVGANWEVLESTVPPKKVDAFTLRFDVPVAGGEEVKLKYRLRIGI